MSKQNKDDIIMPRYYAVEDGGASTWLAEDTTANNANERARDWVREGEYGGEEAVQGYTVYLVEKPTPEQLANNEPHGSSDDAYEVESGTVVIPATVPDCIHADGHDFIATMDVEGGLAENPGVQGNGGGVTIDTHCSRDGCAVTRHVNTWAQDAHGEPYKSTTYGKRELADEVPDYDI